MRRFIAAKVNGLVQTTERLDFGDFVKVDRALSYLPSGRYSVRISGTGMVEASPLTLEQDGTEKVREAAQRLIDRYPTRLAYAVGEARKRSRNATSVAVEKKWAQVAEVIDAYRQEVE